jgi:hypothetical protein
MNFSLPQRKQNRMQQGSLGTSRPRRYLNVLAVVAIGAAVATFFLPSHPQPEDVATRLTPDQISTASDLVNLDFAKLGYSNLSRINFVCALDIPRVEASAATNSGALSPAISAEPTVPASLKKLEQLTQRVRVETVAAWPEFLREPQRYAGSEAFFRLTILDRVLCSDGASMRIPDSSSWPDPIPNPYLQRANPIERGRINYRRPDSLFMSSIVNAERSGTVANLPFLYAAVGRGLGYPLRLALAKGHVFVRWEGGKDSIDVEPAAQELRLTNDSYYERWPVQLQPDEIATGGYLRSLKPAEEAALCLLLRSACLEALGHKEEAARARSVARRWTSLPAVHAQIDQLYVSGTSGKPTRMRLGEFADARLGAEQMMLEAKTRQADPASRGMFGAAGSSDIAPFPNAGAPNYVPRSPRPGLSPGSYGALPGEPDGRPRRPGNSP